jgi:hypothetical protein
MQDRIGNEARPVDLQINLVDRGIGRDGAPADSPKCSMMLSAEVQGSL